MRISHTDLEACIGNPQRWLSTQNAPSHGYKMGYERMLRLAVFHYHKTSPEEARDHLNKIIKKHNLKSAIRISEVEARLESYIDWAVSEHLKAAGVQVKIALPLGFLEMRGEIGRVDVTAQGYRAVLFRKAPPNWHMQLRMPLIQEAVASLYGRPPEQTAVGFQELDGTDLQTVVYSQPQIIAAKKRFRTLGETVRLL